MLLPAADDCYCYCFHLFFLDSRPNLQHEPVKETATTLFLLVMLQRLLLKLVMVAVMTMQRLIQPLSLLRVPLALLLTESE